MSLFWLLAKYHSAVSFNVSFMLKKDFQPNILLAFLLSKSKFFFSLLSFFYLELILILISFLILVFLKNLKLLRLFFLAGPKFHDPIYFFCLLPNIF